MLNKIIKALKRLTCKHHMVLNRWHLVHYFDYEPLSVEAEYICDKCGKADYIYLYGPDVTKWENAMGDYKRA